MSRALRAAAAALCLSLCAGAAAADAPRPQTARISEPGRYQGYSAPLYDDVQRTSVHVPAADGTRLAIDVYRPMRKGRVETNPLPVVFQFTPYNRALRMPDGSVQPYAKFPIGLAAYGYVLAIADVRGKGASFGTRSGPADDHELGDAATLIGWLGRQPWSTGKIGVNGCSYNGSTATQAARAPSDFVKAVFVGSSMLDQYDSFAPGGIASKGLLDDVVPAEQVMAVDGDQGDSLKMQALAEHRRNTNTGNFFAASPFRDDPNPYTGTNWWVRASLYPHLGSLRKDIGFYFHGGYFDGYGTPSVLQYLNLPNPKKLAFGGWSHCESPGFSLDIERLRFFDYWLKGIENGVMREPPVLVQVKRAEEGAEWRALDRWPSDARRSRYYLSPETPPVNPAMRGGPTPWHDGSLAQRAPGADAKGVQLAGLPDVAPIIAYGYAVAGVEAYSASYTLPAQILGREIVGRPSARLWIASPAPDADVYVYLEAIHRRGGAEVIASSALRASHRKTGAAPYDTGGVPWHTHLRADAQPLQPGIPVALDIAFSATAYALQPGDRLRVSVTSRSPRSGKGSETPITVISDNAHPSWIEVPDVDTRERAIAPGLGRPGKLPKLIGSAGL
ncbi:CocE/NonD family hydrolase [Massilia niastensis]|uniref:CocE/NonD family hydrolase n=1 Tax=Massilia niastensis TaxID=544911 RepID=UPI00037F9DFB|nr:CocE/NonD family hydrolase [Massilia niastensis]